MSKNGAAFWITGLPGSGKSTLALAAVRVIPGLVLLQMDAMRRVVTPKPTYSDAEREHLYMALVYTAMVLTREGNDVVIDATANMRRWRDEARAIIDDFHEIYVSCPAGVARERGTSRADTHLAPGDVYQKADAGWPVPGAGAPYEEPLNPELVIDSGGLTEGEAGDILAGYIKGALSRRG